MSTHATYSIHGGEGMGAKLVHFYIHYDGYPEGAAYYFDAMRKYLNSGIKDQFSNKSRGGLAGAFMRANDLAEFTAKPEAHADREYHYELYKDGQLKAFKCEWDDSEKDFDLRKEIPRVFFFGPYTEFLNQYNKEEDFSKVYQVGRLSLSKAEVMDLIAHKHQELADYKAKFPTFSGNIGSMSESLARFLVEAAPALQGAG